MPATSAQCPVVPRPWPFRASRRGAQGVIPVPRAAHTQGAESPSRRELYLIQGVTSGHDLAEAVIARRSGGKGAAMLRRDLHEQNRLSWNKAMPAQNSHKRDQAAFLRAGGVSLFPEERELLGDLAGLSLAHLLCNDGQGTA